jgi:DNA replication protein
MVTEAIDFRFLLMENYKKLHLDENEVITLFMVEHFISSGNPFVTADLLSLKMSLNVKTIDSILASLLTKGFITYVTRGKHTVTSLEPLKEKLYREFQLSMSVENSENEDKEISESLQNIYGTFEKLLKRPLSPVEFSKIREWVSFGYSDELIINALKEALSKNKKSLRSVDKILLAWATREDIETEGHSTISENWRNNLAETIRIAKTPWLDDDEI